MKRLSCVDAQTEIKLKREMGYLEPSQLPVCANCHFSREQEEKNGDPRCIIVVCLKGNFPVHPWASCEKYLKFNHKQ